jgi:hypothetical protein
MTEREIEEAARALEDVSARLMSILRNTPERYALLGIVATTFVVIENEIRNNDESTREQYTMSALGSLSAELRRFLEAHLNEAGLAFEAVLIQ